LEMDTYPTSSFYATYGIGTTERGELDVPAWLRFRGLASSADLFACDRHHLCICRGPVIDIWHGPVSEKSSPPDRHEQKPRKGCLMRLLTRFYSLGGRRPSFPPRSMLCSGRVFAKEPQAGIAVQFPIQGSPADPQNPGRFG